MRLLDLFCGAGGAAVGYHRAGFAKIVGVDHRPMPRYPFAFVLADALEYVVAHGHEFDAIHASPPCQGYSIMRNLPWLRDKDYPLLIAPTAEALNEIGVPWVIENVMGAKLASGWLCGTMFGLPFFRHRFFWASGWFWLQPPHEIHRSRILAGRMLKNRARKIITDDAHISPSGRPQGLNSRFKKNGAQRVGVAVGHAAGIGLARTQMDLEWMSREELTQAIPPAYTEFIGKQLLAAIIRPTPS